MSTQIVPVALRKGAAEILATIVEVADANIVSKAGASKPAQNAIDSNDAVPPTPKAGPWQNGSLQFMIGKHKQP